MLGIQVQQLTTMVLDQKDSLLPPRDCQIGYLNAPVITTVTRLKLFYCQVELHFRCGNLGDKPSEQHCYIMKLLL